MINVQLEYDVDTKEEIDYNWLNIICNKIFYENNHLEGNVTIILSGDDRLRNLKNEYFLGKSTSFIEVEELVGLRIDSDYNFWIAEQMLSTGYLDQKISNNEKL